MTQECCNIKVNEGNHTRMRTHMASVSVHVQTNPITSHKQKPLMTWHMCSY